MTDPRPALPASLAAAVAAGGEMGRRFAEFDWAAHPLGPPADWPPEFCAAVATTLATRFPIVLWLGADDLFLIYNDAYIPMLSDKHPAALGARGEENWWEVWDEIGPMLSGVLATGEATWSADLMLPLVTAGRARERYFTFSYSPLFTAAGGIDGIFCAVSETTDRVLGERRLGLLNALAAELVELRSVPATVAAAVEVCGRDREDLPFVAVYVDDAAGRPVLAAATDAVRELLPTTLEDLTGDHPPGSRAVREIDDLAAVLPSLATVLAEASPERALLLPLAGDPATGVLMIGISPRRPLDEQYRGFCQLLADQLSSAFAAVASYERQRRRADELAELDRAKTAFLSNVSHEFRTPLTLLLGPLDDAAMAAGDDAAQLDRLQTARRSAGRLRRLVDALLDFSRVEAGRAQVNSRTVELGAFTAHIASAFSELCDRAGLRLDLDCAPAAVDVDPVMWETIVLNLLSNAVKFTFAGTITVQVRAEAQRCRICVRDTGIGIDTADLDRIFDRFHRGENTRGRTVEGAGVGLALVRGLVELQGGAIRIDSRVDEGTAVIIEFPLSVSPPAPAGAGVWDGGDNPYVVEAGQWVVPPPAEPSTTGSRRARILVADDNADMRAYLDGVLSEHWNTVLATNGQAALELARARPPDAVVTDVMMPGLDGFGFVAALRADPRLRGIPVIMLSARSGSESASEGYAGGADDYLAKPFRSRELVDRVAARLAAAARERDERERHDMDRSRETAFARLEAGLRAESSSGLLAAVYAWSAAVTETATVGLGVIDTGKACVRVEFASAAGGSGGAEPLALADGYLTADAIRSGAPIIAEDLDALGGDGRGADVPLTAHAGVVHPLRDPDYRMIGALAYWWDEPRRFSAAELATLARTAELVQTALHRIRTRGRERRIALEFQEQLLDLERASTTSVVAAVYQPAEETMRVGGDWYLAVPLDRAGRIGISVGDVVGHGLSAAVVMSRLRSSVAAAALGEPEPGAVLDTVNRYAATVPGAHCATATYAVLDPAANLVEYSCAGHPYPLLIPRDGPPAYLRDGRRPPLATSGFVTGRRGGSQVLAPGDTILLYTDGLIERPGETLDDGFDRLLAAATASACLPTGALCAELLERLRPPGGYCDDVVILALRAAEITPDSFTMAVRAVPDQMALVRERLREWLSDKEIPELRGYDILLAIGEALSNAIEHGSNLDPANTVSVEVTRRGRGLVAAVTDSAVTDAAISADAEARQPKSGRGRGLALMNELADHLSTVRGAHGTTVTLRFDDHLADPREARG
ncbi:response regulator [Nocardia yunnanensis]|uniref:histidine kinase n=1 Tax=Nocardia yunnanensis TaxID=2382165 RepID=A0A386ZM33_9NOCA|nr:SpoIIE family protein phosphatase [Nocardia yunnanensis]AYF77709.1 response regulator [Nocardia yunnanensis]